MAGTPKVPEEFDFLTYFELALRAVGISVGKEGTEIIDILHHNVNEKMGKFDMKDVAKIQHEIHLKYHKDEEESHD